jgi:hypothetical protein
VDQRTLDPPGYTDLAPGDGLRPGLLPNLIAKPWASARLPAGQKSQVTTLATGASRMTKVARMFGGSNGARRHAARAPLGSLVEPL